MGTVWEADDPLLARHIAIKTLDAAIGMDESIRARFRREAVTAAAVTHPNIVATYDTGEDDGVAYIVMELVHGITPAPAHRPRRCGAGRGGHRDRVPGGRRARRPRTARGLVQP